MSLQDTQTAARRNAPQLDRSLEGCREQQSPVGREGHHTNSMPLSDMQRVQELPGLRVPQLRDAIGVGDDEQGAIPGELGGDHPDGAALEHMQALMRLHAPQLSAAIPHASEDTCAVRRKQNFWYRSPVLSPFSMRRHSPVFAFHIAVVRPSTQVMTKEPSGENLALFTAKRPWPQRVRMQFPESVRQSFVEASLEPVRARPPRGEKSQQVTGTIWGERGRVHDGAVALQNAYALAAAAAPKPRGPIVGGREHASAIGREVRGPQRGALHVQAVHEPPRIRAPDMRGAAGRSEDESIREHDRQRRPVADTQLLQCPQAGKFLDAVKNSALELGASGMRRQMLLTVHDG
eukprot:CAMPEP_0170352176 /NCGR_PEP_ID=MMETSP0116_2-20130129/77398_1 /TAXON_ID=400756 /ORGANISM="Durinskia baltica, Strain CSIRO CS-38" /LENGTH=347 /DNA_ID=CAMNT_0010606099 /DNA_START=170 /DNA_END=1210 /DNA_ORIENTATION=+